MKKLCLSLCFLVTIGAAAAPKIKAVKNGKWSQSSTWDLGRKPRDGDTVLIPGNLQVVLDNNESLDDLVVKINGTLKLTNGKLNLNASSRIEVHLMGRLAGSGNNDQVRIGNVFKFRGGVDLSILGPAYADETTGSSPAGFSGGLVILNYNEPPVANSRVDTVREMKVYAIRYGGTSMVYVRFSKAQVDPVTITVMDLNGQLVTRQSYQARMNLMSVQVNNPRQGAYLVLVDNNGRRDIRKLVL
ncbi:MAG TPA: T9SS type A sorting domain-containing protein [Chitinophagaceae bacterium]|nr:T9SS type A sorting domain-containing protein [Chitinophagaceae bacterium]